MSDQFRNIMQQWLDQLERQARSGADWLQQWQSLLEQFPDDTDPQILDLLHQLTRQNHRFASLAEALLSQSGESGLSRESLLDAYQQHLDHLCHDWIQSSRFLPDQIALMTPFISPPPESDGLDWGPELLTRLQALSAFPSELTQRLKGLLTRLIRFQQCRQAHQEELSELNKQALEAFADRLQASGITDLTEAHALWVDTYEARYRAALDNDTFIDSFNRLVNSGSEVKQAWQCTVDLLCRQLGLVSLSDYDALSERHQALQDRVWQLEQQMKALQKGQHRDQD